MLFNDNEGDVATGRKLRVPSMGPCEVKNKLTETNCMLKAEVSGAVAFSHVNRLAWVDERLVEPEIGIKGIFPDTRKMIKSVFGRRMKGGIRRLKVKF